MQFCSFPLTWSADALKLIAANFRYARDTHLIIHETNLPGITLLSRGKVRDIYAVSDGKLLVVATDRISAFDVILDQPIPDKGRVLTQLSCFWFERFKDLGAVARAVPWRRLRTMVSGEHRNSSIKIRHGPTASRPDATRPAIRSSAVGRT